MAFWTSPTWSCGPGTCSWLARPAGANASAVRSSAGFVSRLLIDEFQDTNELQCAILEGLGAERLLMVGDERQSIYRFRGADVEVFRRREEATDLSHHRLDTNYRSRPEILAFINRLFSHETFFGAERFEPLRRRARTVPPEVGHRARRGRRLVDHGSAGRGARGGAEGEERVPLQQAEAYAVAERVRRLVDEEGRSQGDIVLLLPTLTQVNLYQQALLGPADRRLRGARQGLLLAGRGGRRHRAPAASGQSARRPVACHRPALAPGGRVRRLPLSAGARGAGARAPARCGRSCGTAAAANIDREDREKLEAFAERLDALRGRVGRPGLARLIDDALSACDYDLCLLAAPEGKRRFANVRKLMRMAADFEALEGPDLAGFVDLIGSLGDLGDDEGNAPSLAEGEDVVRVMTVHQAKGLEFPGGRAGRPRLRRAAGVHGRVRRRERRTRGGLAQRDGEQLRNLRPPLGAGAGDHRRGATPGMRGGRPPALRGHDPGQGQACPGRERGRTRSSHGASAGSSPRSGCRRFPESGEVIVLDDIDAAIIGVAAPAEGEEAEPGDEEAARTMRTLPGPGTSLLSPVADSDAVISRQISFSALSAFGRCPRRFYLERVLGLGSSSLRCGGRRGRRDSGRGRRPSSTRPRAYAGRDVGLLVHALLEQADLTGAAALL